MRREALTILTPLWTYGGPILITITTVLTVYSGLGYLLRTDSCSMPTEVQLVQPGEIPRRPCPGDEC